MNVSAYPISSVSRSNLKRLLLTLSALPSLAFAAGTDINWAHISTEFGDIPAAPGGTHQTASQVGDFNGDGLMDFIVTDRSVAPSAYLYLRVSDGWERSVIEPEDVNIEAGGAIADIDGDGDLDIAFGQDWTGGEVWWWENPLPSRSIKSSWSRHVVKEGGSGQQHDQAFGDFDGDGDLEFATWANQRQNDGKPPRVEIYEIPANPKSLWTLDDSINMEGEGMFVIDVDEDGIDDILAGTRWIKWHAAGDYRSTVIEGRYPTVSSRIVGGQFVEGGRPEILINSGDLAGPLYYYQYDGSSWKRTELIAAVQNGHTLEVGDIDLDGNLDFYAAEMGDPGAGEDCRAWIGWGDGTGSFELEIITVGIANHESRLVDLDGDGDLDVLAKPFRYGAPRIDAFLNDTLKPGLTLDEWDRHSLDPDMPWQALDVVAGDINGDKLLDIISGGWWYQNPGTVSGNWVRRPIGGDLNNMAWVHDFDGDGDLDIFGTNGKHRGGGMGWAENNGAGGFTYHGNVDDGESGFIQGAIGGVFTEGGPYEVIVQWQGGEDGGSGVDAFIVPANPTSEVWKKKTVSNQSAGEQLSGGDIDGDGDTDLFQGRSWLRNEGNDRWTRFNVADFPSSYGIPDRNRLVDIDRDGDLDAVVGLSDFGTNSPPLLWLEHPVDPTKSWPVHILANGPWGGYSMDALDIDYDGDIDVLLGEHKSTTRTLIYENNGNGSSWKEHVVDSGGAGIDHHVGTKLYDMDGDGDLDIISIGWVNDKLWLFENRSSVGPDTEPPSIPANLNSKSVVGPSIVLAWDPSTDNKEVTEYLVYRDGELIARVQKTTYTDSDIEVGQTYAYYVVAADARSNYSDPSVAINPASVSTEAPWWNSTWPHRVLLTVDTALYPRFDPVVDVEVNFSDVLAKQGKSASLDEGTLRVIEVDETGKILDTAVPLQFDPASDFSAASNAKGNLIFNLVGETPAETTRYYYVYFAPPGVGATPLDFDEEVALLDDVMDEEQLSIQVTNLTGDLFYHKLGAGFSSWVDLDGNDWIGYAPTGDAEGNYRGLPNMVYPENYFHPGETTATTVIESVGPLKATLRSSAGGGAWECVWEFYGRCARMTVTKAPDDYWFVYEGPPGGTFDGLVDFVVRSNGSANPISQTWEGDLVGDEWAYVADPVANRALFVALHQPDQAIDSYRPYGGAMTVLGIGRDKRVGSYLEGTPKTFTIGLIEQVEYEDAKPYVESAYKSFDIYLRGIGIVQTADEEVEAEPDPIPVSDVIENGGFESGKSSWAFYSNGSDSFTTTNDSFAGTNSAQISIGSGGNNIQLFQKGIELQPNAKYRLTFAAYSNTGTDFKVSLQRHDSPYNNYGLSKKQVSLGTEWKNFTIDFTTQGFSNPVSNGRLFFWFADLEEPGDVFYLDNVELKQLTGSTLDTVPPTSPANLDGQLNANNHASLTWEAASDNVGVSFYRVLRDGAAIEEISATSYVDTAVIPGETHAYRVAAVDAIGNASDPSNEVKLVIPGETGSGSGTSIISNSGFESGMYDWTFYSNGSGSSTTTDAAFVGSNALKISIGNGGSNIQLYQHGLVLEPDTSYRLSFAAYSSTGSNMEVSLAKHTSPYGSYGLKNHEVELGNGWQSISIEFTTSGFSGTVEDGRLYFWFADHARGGEFYYIDEVMLVKGGSGGTDTENPSTPSSFAADLNASDDAVLSWGESTDNVGVSHYRIFRNGGTLLDVGTTSYTDTSVVAGQTYRYSVAAVDAANNVSTPTGEEIVAIPGEVAVVVNSIENGSFETTLDGWAFYTNGVGDAALEGPGYEGAKAIKISVVAKGSNTQLYQRGILLEANTRYRLSFAAYSTFGNDLEVSLSKHSSPYNNYGLNQEDFDLETGWRKFSVDFTTTGFGGTVKNGRLYFWFADDARAGETYFIDQVVLAPVDSLADDSEDPSVPENLKASLATNTEVDLEWDQSTDNVGVLGYIVYRDGVDVGNTATTTYSNDGLAVGKNYVYSVTAFDAAGNESGVSNSVTVETPNDGQAPVVPQGVQVTLLSKTTALLTWKPSFDADGVDVYRVFKNGSLFAEVNSTSALDSSLVAGSSYTFRVAAVDIYGNVSELSDSAVANTNEATGSSANMLVNGDVEDGFEGWDFFTNGAGEASQTEDAYQGSGGAAKIALYNRASNVQLYQSDIELNPETEYVLVFAAYSNTGADLEVSLSKHGPPYSDYGLNREKVDLTTEWAIYHLDFTTKNFTYTVNDGRLYFWLADDARSGDIYYFDKLMLFEK